MLEWYSMAMIAFSSRCRQIFRVLRAVWAGRVRDPLLLRLVSLLAVLHRRLVPIRLQRRLRLLAFMGGPTPPVRGHKGKLLKMITFFAIKSPFARIAYFLSFDDTHLDGIYNAAKNNSRKIKKLFRV